MNPKILLSLFFILSIFFVDKAFCQTFKEGNIYLVARGTKSKKVLIGEKFGFQNLNMTHIGIGFVKNRRLQIFNVSVHKKDKGSSLIFENLNEFKNIEDIFYLAIWEFRPKKKVFTKIINSIHKLRKETITFDRKFSLDNENTVLYCSEFVAKVLNESSGFSFSPRTINTDNIIKTLTGKDTFTYFPVDFFLIDGRFKIINEICF